MALASSSSFQSFVQKRVEEHEGSSVEECCIGFCVGRYCERLQKDLLLLLDSNIKASVEGPYGHESPYHLTYSNLILVAGGIGISPYLAILNDILHRISERFHFFIQLIWSLSTPTSPIH
ncbi:hypothetical protein POM88_043557 [Heracleum sosnowskyi]|uniref:Ferric reductase NAD binding domain-containing protein n=1 Tax=Heracleum sosnowskyi TaxID=360622 RepID=A0AAD8H3K5_9APIA|nr:hypothetical protein POM88_043557 [Heracleum sosnowskyi]